LTVGSILKKVTKRFQGMYLQSVYKYIFESLFVIWGNEYKFDSKVINIVDPLPCLFFK
jgi:hypothetical protein